MSGTQPSDSDVSLLHVPGLRDARCLASSVDRKEVPQQNFSNGIESSMIANGARASAKTVNDNAIPLFRSQKPFLEIASKAFLFPPPQI